MRASGNENYVRAHLLFFFACVSSISSLSINRASKLSSLLQEVQADSGELPEFYLQPNEGKLNRGRVFGCERHQTVKGRIAPLGPMTSPQSCPILYSAFSNDLAVS